MIFKFFQRIGMGAGAMMASIAAVAGVMALASLSHGHAAYAATPTTVPMLPVASAAPMAPAMAIVSGRDATMAQYGIYPLPVEAAAISQFHLTNQELADVAAARQFADTAKARRVRECESSGDYQIVDRGYYGAWQFDRETWLSNGGGRFAPTANLAPAWAQDYLMWKTHEVYGWGPWSCA